MLNNEYSMLNVEVKVHLLGFSFNIHITYSLFDVFKLLKENCA